MSTETTTTGTAVTARDLTTGETETVEITDNHVVITDGRSYISSIVAHANGTQVITIKRADTVEEARSATPSITRYFPKAATR